MSEVFARTDERSVIVEIEGGYTLGNIKDFANWTKIDEGVGDKYNLCQSNYLEKGLIRDDGVYQYKLIDGAAVERSADEMSADETNEEQTKSLADEVAELKEQNEMLLECILELSTIIYE